MATDEAFAYLLTRDVPALVINLQEIQGLAIEHGLTALREEISAILTGFLDDLNRVAVQMAGLADGWIIAKLFETQSRNRPHTVNMEGHIVSEPGPLGSVQVAKLDQLDRIVNPRGAYGPFWRAQEYGTGAAVDYGPDAGDEIPSQEGRRFVGTYEPSQTPPDSEQRGLGVGRDLAFTPGGENPGLGVISVDLPGRHFLRDGTAETGSRYLAAMDEVQSRWRAKFADVMYAFKTQQASTRTISLRLRA
jgi:hypothetical protein